MTFALAHETLPAESLLVAPATSVETAERAPRWAVGLLALSVVLTLLWTLFLVWGGYKLLAMIATQLA